jgi:hypothetical protein
MVSHDVASTVHQFLLGGFSGAATAATSLSTVFSEIGSSPYASAAAGSSPRADSSTSGVEDFGAAGAGTDDGTSTSDNGGAGGSAVASASDELLAALAPGYYLPEDEFDPVRHVLESMLEAHDGELTTELLQQEVGTDG